MFNRRLKESDSSQKQAGGILDDSDDLDDDNMFQNQQIYNQTIQKESKITNNSQIQSQFKPINFSNKKDNTIQQSQFSVQGQDQFQDPDFNNNDQTNFNNNIQNTQITEPNNNLRTEQSFINQNNNSKQFFQPLKPEDDDNSNKDKLNIKLAQSQYSVQNSMTQSKKVQQINSNRSKGGGPKTKREDVKDKINKAGDNRNIMKAIRKFLYGDMIESSVFPVWMENPMKNVIFDTIVPSSLMFVVLTLVYAIQQEANDHCYIEEEDYLECPCDGKNVKFWSFLRMMIVYKLAHLSYRRQIMKSLVAENPYVESFLFYFFAVGIDFVLVMYIEVNHELVFLTIVYILGLIIPSHILRYQNFGRAVWHARGLIFYDLVYLLAFTFIYYGLPEIYELMVKDSNLRDARINFIYVYPFIEIILDVILDIAYSFTNQAEFFMYQLQQIQLGLRVGILISINHVNFEYWYLMVAFCLKRLNSQTQFINTMIRRIIQQCLPRRFKAKLNLSEIYRGKNGAYMEFSILWILFYYLCWGLDFFLPFRIKETIVVNDCQFNTPPLFQNIPWHRPFVAWIGLLVGEFTGIFLNQETQLDTIKWLGAREYSLADNILIRICGWYFFSLAMIFPMTDINYEGTPLFINILQQRK